MTLPPLEELKRLNGRRDLPWKVTEKNAVTDRFGWSIFVDEETNDTVGTATPQDAQLVALAPELAAEVIRLREELTQWQEAARDMQTLGKADIPITKMWEYINDRIARILEGDSQND